LTTFQTDSSQKPEPVIEEPKKLSSVYDRLYANSKPKVRKRIEENPKKVEKPKKKPVKKERSFNVDHKVISVTPGLHVENEKETKPRVSVYDRLYKTTTESRRAQQKVTLPQVIFTHFFTYLLLIYLLITHFTYLLIYFLAYFCRLFMIFFFF